VWIVNNTGKRKADFLRAMPFKKDPPKQTCSERRPAKKSLVPKIHRHAAKRNVVKEKTEWFLKRREITVEAQVSKQGGLSPNQIKKKTSSSFRTERGGGGSGDSNDK